MKRTQKNIKASIYLSGLNGDYTVHHNIAGEEIVCYVPSTKIGNAIVRALRALQGKKK